MWRSRVGSAAPDRAADLIRSQGLGIDGRLAGDQPKQNVRQIMKDMARNTGARSWCVCVAGIRMSLLGGVGKSRTSPQSTLPKTTPCPLSARGGPFRNPPRRPATRPLTKQSRRSYAKGFGAMGALFAGSECVIEKVRAKHDMYNSVYAGCTAGAILAHSGGPKAMAVGCSTFAAFSAAIDYFMGHH